MLSTIFFVYKAMIDSKRRFINEEDDELDDELEMVSIVLIGQYRKIPEENEIGAYKPARFSYWT
jgi:hypothetical protein